MLLLPYQVSIEVLKPFLNLEVVQSPICFCICQFSKQVMIMWDKTCHSLVTALFKDLISIFLGFVIS